jgi:Concanavalin A-like lectin/glucanases superfamily
MVNALLRKHRRGLVVSTLLTLAWLATGAGGLAMRSDETATSVVALRSAEQPTLDGRCNESAYADSQALELRAVHAIAGSVRVQQSGRNAYVCASGLGAGVQQFVVLVDTTPAVGGLEGVIRLAVTRGGAASLAASAAGGAFREAGAPGDVEGVVAGASEEWGAELRIRLDWLGGYARSDGLAVLAEDAAGLATAQWPAGAVADRPASWGTLALAPTYRSGARSGSVFVDGRGGHVVLPQVDALVRPPFTIEAWVRLLGDDCGQLLGSEAPTSLSLGICGVLSFRMSSVEPELVGGKRLDAGWHHVAVTATADGERSLVLDGALDGQLAMGPAAARSPDAARSAASPAPLLLGGSADPSLHAEVHGLEIWNGARGLAQIRRDAFAATTREPGLVGLWPFAGSLADIAGGRDAGLAGNAVLARATLDLRAFPGPPRAAPRRYVARPRAPWGARLALTRGPVTVDGMCTAGEYRGAAEVPLEPVRGSAFELLLTPDALYVCTNLLYGTPGESSVAVLVQADGASVPAPTGASLRVELTPRPGALVARGHDARFARVAAAGIVGRAISGRQLVRQDDARPAQGAFWSAEVRIPLADLRPFRPGRALRLALRYRAAPQTNRILGADARWPRSFDEAHPSTWGLVVTTAKPGRLLPIVRHPESATRVLDNPPAAPTAGDFSSACPFANNSPAALGYVFVPVAKWPLVDASHPFRRAEGTLLGDYSGVSISNEDAFPIHLTHDVDMRITPTDATSQSVMLQGDDSLVLESEFGGLSPQARPRQGDHVTAVGRWIFDCGHDAKTELHPVFALESDHEALRSMRPGGPLARVRVAKVWFNTAPSAGVGPEFWPAGFVHTVGSFDFDVPVPFHKPGTMPFVRVTGGPAGNVKLTSLSATSAHFTVKGPTGIGDTALYGIMVGFVSGTEDNGASSMFRVTFDQLAIDDDLDDEITRGDGDWYLWAVANGVWRNVFPHVTDSVDDDDSPFDLSGVGTVTLTGGDLDLEVTGYEDDSPYADPNWCAALGASTTSLGAPGAGSLACLSDDTFGTDLYPQGALDSLADGKPHTLAGDDWTLTYHVDLVSNSALAPVFADSTFWQPRLVDEPNDLTPTNLGTIHVPAPQAEAAQTQHDAHIAERTLAHDGIFLIGSDVDKYTFATDDFATITFKNTVPGGVVVDPPQKIWSSYYAGSLPQSLQDLLGYEGANVTVHSTNGQQSDKAYSIRFDTTYRVLPPDPGESSDGTGGRPVDLVDDGPGLVTTPGQVGADNDIPAQRKRTMPWAWQHVQGDVDLYDVYIPSPTPAPPFPDSSKCDQPAQLELSAPDERLTVVFITSGNDEVTVPNLAPGGPQHYLVSITPAAAKRSVYRLTATWSDAIHVPAGTCALREAKAKLQQVNSTVLTKPPFGGHPNVIALDPSIVEQPWTGGPVYSQGGYTALIANGPSADLVISSPAGEPVSALLLDSDAVLLAETTPIPVGASIQANVPDGLVPQARLHVSGLTAGATYFLVPMPSATTAADGAVATRIGLSGVLP